ncbi:MAG: hypothetical protein QOH12_3911 [Solirubrobacteraceae bacterium]|nr:hypothetical protein [Solirubrobacteraceae bacterium]
MRALTAPRGVRGCGLSDADSRAFGEVLRKAGYGGGQAELVGGEADLSVLARLFALGASVPRETAAATVEPVGLEALESAGIVEARGEGRVGSSMRVTPCEELLFLHDRADLRGPSDQVAAVGPASLTLASLTIRRPVELALDLGTGCGVQALLASRHAGRVIATDVSGRALDVARVNAAINRIENVELRVGNLFEPVAGERFDLIVANPPFVISPETSHVFRDSDLPGDAISELVVGGATELLAEGGHATILCEWICRAGEDWPQAPRRWTDGRGCDALALHYNTADPETYAAAWNGGLREIDPDGYVETVERWAAYQRSLDVAGVSTGAVVLRRRGRSGRGSGSTGSWFRAEEMPGGPSGGAGEHLLRVFAAEDVLPARRADVLECRLRLAVGQELRQLVAYGESGWESGDAELRSEPGIGVSVVVPGQVVHVVLSLDGERTLAAVIDQAADELGAEPEGLREAAGDLARRLVELGFCEVVGPQ